MFFAPSQLASQALEAAHAATGLPWWASIPVVALTARAVLMPLTVKAKAASASIPLLHLAFTQASLLGPKIDAGFAAATLAAASAPSTTTSSPLADLSQSSSSVSGSSDAGPSTSSAAEPSSAATGQAKGSVEGKGAVISRLALTRHILSTTRQRQGVPAFKWYLLAGGAQLSVFLSVTWALREMSRAVWPGLTDEGLLYFTDLTAPAVYLQTISTPLGPAGAILPLAAVLLYITSVDRSAGAKSPNTYLALRLLAIPFYGLALLQPHATLIYWITHFSLQQGTQSALAAAHARGWLHLSPALLDEEPQPAAAPAALAPVSSDQGSASTAGSAAALRNWQSDCADPTFLAALAQSLSRKHRHASLGAYYAALQLDAGCAPALRGAALEHAACGQWHAAAELSKRCAAAAAASPADREWALLHAGTMAAKLSEA